MRRALLNSSLGVGIVIVGCRGTTLGDQTEVTNPSATAAKADEIYATTKQDVFRRHVESVAEAVRVRLGGNTCSTVCDCAETAFSDRADLFRRVWGTKVVLRCADASRATIRADGPDGREGSADDVAWTVVATGIEPVTTPP